MQDQEDGESTVWPKKDGISGWVYDTDESLTGTLDLMVFVVCGGLIFELLRIIFSYF